MNEEEWSPVFTVMVEKKYRIIIPTVIRKILGLEPGDLIEVKIRRVGRKWKVLRE